MSVPYSKSIREIIFNEYEQIRVEDIKKYDCVMYARQTDTEWRVNKGGYIYKIDHEKSQLVFKTDIFYPWSYMWRVKWNGIIFFRKVPYAKRLEQLEKRVEMLEKRLSRK